MIGGRSSLYGPYIYYYDVGPNMTVYHNGQAYGVRIEIKKNEKES